MNWRAALVALVAWSPSALATAGAAAQWNAYIVLSLILGGFVMVLTLAVLVAEYTKDAK